MKAMRRCSSFWYVRDVVLTPRSSGSMPAARAISSTACCRESASWICSAVSGSAAARISSGVESSLIAAPKMDKLNVVVPDFFKGQEALLKKTPLSVWKDYLAFHMARPAAERQKMMHQSHNAYVAPDERRFVTPEVIKRFCIVGKPAEVLEQVRELERRGVRQLMCNFPLERGYQMVRDYAKNIIQKL